MKLKFLAILVLIALAYAAENDDDDDKPTVCSSCTCSTDHTIIDCSHLNLYNMLTKTDLTPLKNDTELLNLSHNYIANLIALPIMEKITFIDLSHNEIKSIEKGAFKELTIIEEINLSHNKLTSDVLIPEVFVGNYDAISYEPLKELKTLRLSYNLLHSLNPDLFEHFPALENLFLDNNPFTIIDAASETAISGVPKLRVLDLSYMELTSLPQYLLHSPRGLQVLNLTGNLLSEIPVALGYAVNLQYLSLDENPIINFTTEHKFETMTKLEVLSISYMPSLVYIGKGTLSGLQNLKELHCSNNPHLSGIHSQALSRRDEEDQEREVWPPIKSLYLHNTNISYLDSHLIGRWDEIEVVDIRNNAWSCDCENQWIVDTLLPKMKDRTPELAAGVICEQPIEMKGIKMIDLTDKNSNLRCLDKYGRRPEGDGAVLVGVLVGLLVGIPITLAIVMVYKRGCFGFISQGPADYSRAFYKRTGVNEDFHI